MIPIFLRVNVTPGGRNLRENVNGTCEVLLFIVPLIEKPFNIDQSFFEEPTTS